MRKHPLLLSFIALVFTGCSLSSDSTSDGLGSECNSGCEEGSGDGDTNVNLSADASVLIAGTGIYIGLDPLCSVDVSGEFYASAKATAKLDGDTWAIADVAAGAAIEAGNGCSCEGIDAMANASIEVDLAIAATLASCQHACGENNGCNDACNREGNVIVADGHVTLDANASVSIGAQSKLDALIGATLDVELRAVVDASGNVVLAL